jgi:SAM-dependent methyltransferase
MSYVNPVRAIVRDFSTRARIQRASLFRESFLLDEGTRILDLGSENGSNIHSVLKGTLASHENVYIADIDATAVQKGSRQYGYIPVFIDESEKLPFPDGFFDIVYCSSVIEHVTVPKSRIWNLRSGKQFKSEALARQRRFADEIKRLGRQYFVQTPNRNFLIESHSWLPFLGWLPRRLLIPTLKVTNRIWVKKTSPDWHLLTARQMCELFDDAGIELEKVFGLTKSIIAIRSTLHDQSS